MAVNIASILENNRTNEITNNIANPLANNIITK